MDIGDQQERWTVASRVENTRGYAEGEIFLLANTDDHLDATVVWESRRDTRATASMVAAMIASSHFILLAASGRAEPNEHPPHWMTPIVPVPGRSTRYA